MPQSTAKSQSNKDKSMTSTRVSPPGSQEQEEKVPRRLLRGQWANMLYQDEGNDKVGVIVNDLVSRVMDGCLKVFIQSQLAPHSASWAKSYIIQVLEQQIICPDEGEEPQEASKTEDSEPVPAPYDAWAQGCVPVIRPTTLYQPSGAQMGVDSVQVQQSITPKQAVKDQSLKSPVSDKQSCFPSPRPQQQQMGSTSRPVQGTVLPPLSSSIVRKDMKVESTKTVYISGPLYQQRVDSDQTTSTLAKISGPLKQEQKNTKQQPERLVTTLPPLSTSKNQSAKLQKSK